MPTRRRSRQRALQILFLWDARRQPVDEAINAYYDTLYSEEHPDRDPFVCDLVRGTVQYLAEVDQQITKHAEHWRMERMAAVDRNLLRLPATTRLLDPSYGTLSRTDRVYDEAAPTQSGRAGLDYSYNVAAARLLEGLGERLLGCRLGDLVEGQVGHEAATRRRRIEVLECHLSYAWSKNSTIFSPFFRTT